MKNREIKKYENSAPPQAAGDQFIRVPAGYEVIVEDHSRDDRDAGPDLFRRLWPRRWLILAILLPCIAASFYFAQTAPPTYKATARLRVGVNSPRIQPFQPTAEAERRTVEDPVLTHMNILRSPTIAEPVVAQLNYHPTRSPWGKIKDKIKNLPLVNSIASGNTASGEVPKQERVNAFLSGLSVTRVPETPILEASYTSTDPQFSALALNTLCEAYQQHDFQSRAAAYSEAQRWLQSSLADIKVKLAASEEALLKFTGADGKEFLMLTGDAQDFYKQMEELRLKIGATEDDYNRRKADHDKLAAGVTGGSSASTGADSPALAQLRAQLAIAEVDFDKARQSLGPLDSTYKTAEAARNRLAQQVAEEEQRLRSNARFELDRSRDQLAQYRQAYNDRQQRIIGLQQRLSEYNILKREVDLNRDMYNNLLQKWQEISIGQSVQPAEVAVFQPAAVPLAASYGERNKILLAGLLAGLVLSLALALLFDRLDRTLKTGDQVWRLTHLPTLGHIPRASELGAINRRKVAPELLSHEFPYSAFADSFRALRTSIDYAFSSRDPRTLLISSGLAGEGKTMVASNLAISNAQKGKRVLLIDADLKKPGLHKAFDVPNDKGLTHLLTSPEARLAEENGIDGAIAATRVPNLYLMPSGPLAPNTADLLDSRNMQALLEIVSQRFDTIIIDSAPLMNIADTPMLAPHVDGIVVVVRPGKTPEHVFAEVTGQISAIGGHILGAVLNNPVGNVGRRSTDRYHRNYGGPRLAGGGTSGPNQRPVINVLPQMPAASLNERGMEKANS